MSNNKKHSSHSHHNHGDMDHSKHDHNEMEHHGGHHDHHAGHDHSGHGGHDHHHHGDFKELFLKSLPMGIIIMLLSPMFGFQLPFQFTFQYSDILVALLSTILHIYGGKPFYMGDRKSTRLNSSHVAISYAVFSFKKK